MSITQNETDFATRLSDGISAAREGRFADAEAALREAAKLDPSSAQPMFNLGVLMAEQEKLDEAGALFREAIRLSPGYVQAHLNLANTLASENKKPESIEHYRRALSLSPESAEALNGLGFTLVEMGRWEEAAVYLQQAIRLKPDFPEAHNSLGLAFNDLGKWEEAEAAFDRALRLNPQYVEAHTNLGSCYSHQGKLTAALASYDLALWLNPDQISTHWNCALALLQLGDFENGWKEYEWRWRRKKTPMRPLPRPMWDGSPLEGKTILLWSEQGLGDTVQFSRYVPLVKERGAVVALECPEPLLKLMSRFDGVNQLVPEGQPLPEFDVHAPLMSLPRLFQTRLDNVPARVPYLRAQDDRIQRWRHKLASDTKFKVGIAWQGNPHHQWDRYRSILLAALDPLARTPGVTLYSLQRGPGSEQLRDEMSGSVMNALDPALSDAEAWAEIAALMTNLDLVITVDTATAHVAGALGIRSFLLVAAVSDWRWLQGRSDSPWYPRTRLFRQQTLGDWAKVIATVQRELRELVLASESCVRDPAS